MRYSEFEKHIKNELYSTTAFVDTEALIKNIHSAKGKIGKRILVLLIVFSGVLSIGVYIFNKTNSKPSEQKIPVQFNQNKTGTGQSLAKKPKHLAFDGSILKSENTFDSGKTPAKIPSRFNNNASIEPQQLSNNSSSSNVSNIISKRPETKTSGDNLMLFNKKDRNNFVKISVLKSLNSFVTYRRKNIILAYISAVNVTDCYNFGSGIKMHWLLGVEIGLGKPFRLFEYTDAKQSEVFEIRDKNENPLEALHSAVFAKVISNRIPFFGKAGISYDRITEQLKYKYSYVTKDTTHGIISITQSQNGDTLTVIKGDIIKDITVERNLQQHYYFHLIDIPFSVGYAYRLNGIDLEAEVGASLNIRMFGTGKILTDKNTISSLKDLNLFKKEIGISYFGGFNMLMNVSYRGQMYAGLRFKYFPKTFSNGNNQIKQNYSLSGLNIGFLYHLAE